MNGCESVQLIARLLRLVVPNDLLHCLWLWHLYSPKLFKALQNPIFASLVRCVHQNLREAVSCDRLAHFLVIGSDIDSVSSMAVVQTSPCKAASSLAKPLLCRVFGRCKGSGHAFVCFAGRSCKFAFSGSVPILNHDASSLLWLPPAWTSRIRLA